MYRRTDFLVLRDARWADRAGRGAQGEPGPAVLPGRRGPGAGRAGGDGLGRLTGDRRRQRHRAGRGGRAGRPGQRGDRAVRARQLHLGAGADPGAGDRGGPAGAPEAAGPGPAGGGLRRGPAAGGAGAGRGAGRGPGHRAPGAVVPAAVPRIGDRAGCPGGVPGHPPGAPAAGLAADRLRAVAAVPPALLRRRARPGRPVPAGPGPRGGAGKTLTKCCLLERGLEVDGDTAVVPWGANLDEVREGLRKLLL